MKKIGLIIGLVAIVGGIAALTLFLSLSSEEVSASERSPKFAESLQRAVDARVDAKRERRMSSENSQKNQFLAFEKRRCILAVQQHGT